MIRKAQAQKSRQSLSEEILKLFSHTWLQIFKLFLLPLIVRIIDYRAGVFCLDKFGASHFATELNLPVSLISFSFRKGSYEGDVCWIDQYLYSLIFSYTNLYTYIFANITVSWLYIFRGSLLFCLILSSPKCFTSIWLHFFLLELKSMALGLIKWTNLSLTFKANRIIRWLTFFFTVYAHFM